MRATRTRFILETHRGTAVGLYSCAVFTACGTSNNTKGGSMSRSTIVVAAVVIALGTMPDDAAARGPTCAPIGPCVEHCPADPSPESATTWCRNTFPSCGEPTLAFWVCATGCGPANWEQIVCNWAEN